jgi:broad specificity phosphatase PhoE
MLADMVRKFNPRRDFEAMFDKAMERWLSGQFDREYEENWPDFKKRTERAFHKLLEDTGETENAMVITSGGVISSIILNTLDLPDSYFMRFNKKLVNCGVTKLVKHRNGVFLSSVNDHSVFEKKADLITYI